ncbi:sulfurtransferase complex subunit TusB [Methylocucumis oryzae]|uniref:Sulfur relay protein DsrH n=1 Tax=Methylocucumis oryzae TaxID=1632867 RepID=A0A0F3IHQ8_9GAMM|nr:sulfurtransferase complex subunit TusB [Methylocucumis oryzae]KJV06212.1 hypothetical protein VZ94_12740 [Methylocucumis oryzae]
MLHLVSQTTLSAALFARISAGDAVLFMGASVTSLLACGQQNQALIELTQYAKCYALSADVHAANIGSNELTQNIHVIDYPEFVQLAVEHPLIQTWS